MSKMIVGRAMMIRKNFGIINLKVDEILVEINRTSPNVSNELTFTIIFNVIVEIQVLTVMASASLAEIHLV